MNNKVFESIVKNNDIIIKVNQNNEKLVTKEQFIDDLLTRENAENIADCLQNLSDVKDYQTEWSMINFYCRAIKGLDDAIFLEMTVKTLTGIRDINNNYIEQLKNQKIKCISDFANYLYK